MTISCARVSLWAAVSLTLAVAFPFAAQATTIERVISPSGIEAWLVHDSTVPLVTMDFAFAGGSAQDPSGKPGVANMTTSLLDEGAGDLNSKAFQQRLADNAIEFRMRADLDYVRGSLRTLKENRNEAFSLLRLALTAPRFDAEPVERIRAQLLSQLTRESTSPNEIASRRWWEAAFPNHPYGQSVRGTLESVRQITADDLHGYASRMLTRSNLKIGIVGDIDAAEAGRMVDSVFGSLPVKANVRAVPHIDPQGMGHRIVTTIDVPQTVVTFGGAGIGRNDPDFMAGYLANQILGGGSTTSRLYREVREVRGLAYSVYTRLVWFRDAAVFMGGTATRSDRAAETIDLVGSEIARFAAEGPTQTELDDARSYLVSSFVLGLDTSSKIAAQLVQMQIDDLGIDYIDRRAAMLQAVTLDDAKRVAKRLFGGGLLIAVAGKPRGLAAAE